VPRRRWRLAIGARAVLPDGISPDVESGTSARELVGQPATGRAQLRTEARWPHRGVGASTHSAEPKRTSLNP